MYAQRMVLIFPLKRNLIFHPCQKVGQLCLNLIKPYGKCGGCKSTKLLLYLNKLPKKLFCYVIVRHRININAKWQEHKYFEAQKYTIVIKLLRSPKMLIVAVGELI